MAYPPVEAPIDLISSPVRASHGWISHPCHPDAMQVAIRSLSRQFDSARRVLAGKSPRILSLSGELALPRSCGLSISTRPFISAHPGLRLRWAFADETSRSHRLFAVAPSARRGLGSLPWLGGGNRSVGARARCGGARRTAFATRIERRRHAKPTGELCLAGLRCAERGRGARSGAGSAQLRQLGHRP